MNVSMVNITWAVPADSSSLLDSLVNWSFFTLFLVGVPIHSYVIWLIVTESGVATDLFFLCLSVCEIGNCLDSFLWNLTSLNAAVGTLMNFVQGFGITGRPVFQCLMCVERFLAVVHPVTFLKLKPLRYRIFCCSVAWIIILASCVSCLFIVDSNSSVYTWFFSSQFLFFIFINVFCLVMVLRVLKQSGPGERKEENHRKRRAFLIILVTTVSMIIIYTPFIIYGLLAEVTGQQTRYDDIRKHWPAAILFFVVAGFLQTLMYLRRTGKLTCHCTQL